MTNDILLSLNGGDVSVLTLLDLPAAFDIIYHNILFHRLQYLYGISGTVPSWFEYYLTCMIQTITVNGQSSRPSDVFFGVRQGSVRSPILFILYSAPLCSLSPTDDTQLLQSCPDQIHAIVLNCLLFCLRGKQTHKLYPPVSDC